MIKWIIILIIIIAVLSYFGINIQSVLESPTSQNNYSFVWNAALNIWNAYLKAPFDYVWNHVLSIIWGAFEQGLNNLKNGKNFPNLDNVSPKNI